MLQLRFRTTSSSIAILLSSPATVVSSALILRKKRLSKTSTELASSSLFSLPEEASGLRQDSDRQRTRGLLHSLITISLNVFKSSLKLYPQRKYTHRMIKVSLANLDRIRQVKVVRLAGVHQDARVRMVLLVVTETVRVVVIVGAVGATASVIG